MLIKLVRDSIFLQTARLFIVYVFEVIQQAVKIRLPYLAEVAINRTASSGNQAFSLMRYSLKSAGTANGGIPGT